MWHSIENLRKHVALYRKLKETCGTQLCPKLYDKTHFDVLPYVDEKQTGRA